MTKSELLIEIHRARARIEREQAYVDVLVAQAKDEGASAARIAGALGISKPQVYRRYYAKGHTRPRTAV